MIRALVFGLGAGAALQAWRNFPADGPVSPALGIWLSIAGLVLAFVAGRAARSPSVVSAHAEAHSEAVAAASNKVQVVMVNHNGEQPAASAPAGPLAGLESAPWMVGASTRPDLEALLDASEVEAILEDGHAAEDRAS